MHGNVAELITEDPQLAPVEADFKRLTYQYDLLNGNVKSVSYQKGHPDQWYHKYEYDADNRIKNVYTSNDNHTWERDARFDYYDHGPVARKEIGELKIQGLDYVYNLQGWLKRLNSNTGNKTRDPGKDGETGTNYLANQPDVHARFAHDVFGFSLGYYDDDYAAIDASKDNFIADESSQSSNLYNLYNGNISHAVTALLDQNHEPLDVHLKRYRYDQLNRLKSQTVYTSANVIANNNWNSATTNGDYDVSLTYDENGNIMTLDRHGYGSNQDMDDLVYSYNSGTNQLNHVTENAPGTPFDDYEGSTSGNYQYNEIGQLISDDEAEIANIEWNVYGKVKSITRTTGSTLPDLAFRYDPFGNRIMKVEKTKDGSGNLEDEDEWIYTHYRTDASGNTMAVYETKTENTNYLAHSVKERYIYGSKRLGADQQTQRMIYGRKGTYNGLGDYTLNRIKRYSTGSEYLVTFSGGTISSSSNTKFFFTLNKDWSYQTIGCNTTGSLESLVSCVAGQMLNHNPLDTIRVSDTSFIITATDFFMLKNAQISYNKVNDLKITIEEVDSPLRKQYAYHRYGKSRYELSNHLGNVQSVISNRKISKSVGGLCLDANNNDHAESSLYKASLTDKVTLQCWVRTTDSSNTSGFAATYYDISQVDRGVILGTYGGRARAGGRNGTGSLYDLVGSTNIADGQWHHIAMTSDGTNWKLYVDGVEEDSRVTPTGNFTSSSMYEPFTIGKTQYDGGYFNGCVKEVSFWNAVRPDTTIANDYSRNREFSGSEKNLIGYWKVDETTGTTITDYSSGNHDLTVSTSSGWSTSTQEYLAADIISYKDYYPFGSLLPGRNGGATEYRYGFNGMEGDPELKGTGNHYTTLYRQYDSRLGRWFSTDPVVQPWMSPYMAFDGNPILYADPRGDVSGIGRNKIAGFFTRLGKKIRKAFSGIRGFLAKRRARRMFRGSPKQKNYDVDKGAKQYKLANFGKKAGDFSGEFYKEPPPQPENNVDATFPYQYGYRIIEKDKDGNVNARKIGESGSGKRVLDDKKYPQYNGEKYEIDYEKNEIRLSSGEDKGKVLYKIPESIDSKTVIYKTDSEKVGHGVNSSQIKKSGFEVFSAHGKDGGKNITDKIIEEIDKP